MSGDRLIEKKEKATDSTDLVIGAAIIGYPKTPIYIAQSQ